MAYGFQYIPGMQADPRSDGHAVPIHAATDHAVSARVFRVAPAASAVAEAIAALYRDIEELRSSAAEAAPGHDRSVVEAGAIV